MLGPTATPGAGAVKTDALPPLPSVVSHAQGGRYTLAVSALEDEGGGGGGGGGGGYENGEANGNAAAAGGPSYVFGEAARQSLSRSRRPLEKGLVRRLSSLDLKAVGEGEDGAADSSEDLEEARMGKEAAEAFFSHLADLVCDAASCGPSELCVILNAPVVGADATVLDGVISAAEGGLKRAMIAKGELDKSGKKKKAKKGRRKEDGDDDVKYPDGGVVIGVLSDAAAICAAHGLTAAAPAPDWTHALVIDWGASGLTLSSVRRLPGGTLSVTASDRDVSCSGRNIADLLVKHCASQFERKNRVSGMLDSRKAKMKLERACEDAVRTLGQGGASNVTVTCDGLYEGLDLQVLVSRPRFDMLCGPTLRKARALLEASVKSLAEEGTGEDNGSAVAPHFDAVLVAGSVGLMPAATAIIDGVFKPNGDGKAPWRGRAEVPADEAVALGCAVHATELLEPRNRQLLLDETSGKGEGQEGGGRQNKLKDGPEEVNVRLCPVAVGVRVLCGGDGDPADNSTAAIPLIEMGSPLPAHVTSNVEVPAGDVEGVEPPLLELVQIVNSGKGEDQVVRLLARIEDLPPGSAELTIEISKEGKLTMAINGGETVEL